MIKLDGGSHRPSWLLLALSAACERRGVCRPTVLVLTTIPALARFVGSQIAERYPVSLRTAWLDDIEAADQARAASPNAARGEPEDRPADDHKLLGRIKGGGFRGFGKLKLRMDGATKLVGWRWHDLRRTARTGMTRLGVPRDHAEAAINHVSGRSKLERTYDRHDYGPEVIAALTLWQGHVAHLVERGAEDVARGGRPAA